MLMMRILPIRSTGGDDDDGGGGGGVDDDFFVLFVSLCDILWHHQSWMTKS